MKNKILLITTLLLIFCGMLSSHASETKINPSEKDSLIVYCSSDLFNLTSQWANEYNNLNPSVIIKVNNIPVSKIKDLKPGISLGFISGEYYGSINNKDLWKEVVGRDVIVPVINSRNPNLDQIREQGIASDVLAKVFQIHENRNWGILLGNGQKSPINFYFTDNRGINSQVDAFLGVTRNSDYGIRTENEKEMISAIQNDPNAIGFCRLNDILDPGKQQILENICLMPIDRNGNGKIDYSERIYNNLNDFNRAVWIGKYPRSLYSNIYSFSSSQPKDETQLAFLKWIITDGQQYVAPNGYSELALNERQSKLGELAISKIDLTESKNDYADLKIIVLILAAFLLASFSIDAGLRYRESLRESIHGFPDEVMQVLNEKSVNVLNGLYFDRTHTWAFMDKDGMVKIGVGDFLQHITGSVTQVKMKNPGESIKKCEPVLSIVHDGKQITLNAPVSGIIREQNGELIKNASLVNSSPYSEGWIYKIEPTNWMREIQFLFMGDKYKIWLKDEFARLRDFFTAIVKPDHQVILQDGGEIKDSPLSELGPEVWEEFQIKFINTSR